MTTPKKSSLLQRLRDKVSAAAKRLWSKREKEEEKLPAPVTIVAKKSRIKQFFSSVWEASPWSMFKKKRIKELEAEIVDLKKRKDFPEVDFERVLPEPDRKPPVEPLILDDDFAAERYKMSNVISLLKNKLASFAKDPLPVKVDGSLE